MRAGLGLLVAFLASWIFAAPHARALDRLGIVLVHGKGGMPRQFTPMAETLAAQNYFAEQPEMCWSRNRIYDKLYLDCLRDIDAAAGRLKTRGATAIVILGMSLGGNAALAHGATRPELKGMIALAPAHSPEFISLRPEVAASLARARTLIAAGQGDVKTTFNDVNTGIASYNFSVNTTPKIYASFFAPDSPAAMPTNAARLTAPLLYVAATNDPTQRGRGYIFDRAPAHPLSRYVTVSSDHIGTPTASIQVVLSWLKELAGP